MPLRGSRSPLPISVSISRSGISRLTTWMSSLGTPASPAFSRPGWPQPLDRSQKAWILRILLFRNPGNYQRFVLSNNDACIGGSGNSALPDDITGSYRDGFLKIDDRRGPGPPPGIPCSIRPLPTQGEFRSETTINTLTVLGPARADDLGRAARPGCGHVRVLISGPWNCAQRRRRVRRLGRLVKREIGRAPASPSDDERFLGGRNRPAGYLTHRLMPRPNATYRKLILFGCGVAAPVRRLAGMILACDTECWGGCWQPVD